MSRKIAFDLDGVLYPWHEVIVEYMRLNHPRNFPNFNMDNWNETFQSMPKMFQEYLLSITPLLEVRDARKEHVDLLNSLAKENEIFYITSRSLVLDPAAKRVTERWLTRNGFPFIENLIFSSSKRAEVLKNNIDILVEDRWEYLKDCEGTCDMFLVTKSWNIDKPDLKNCIRIDDVIELKEYLAIKC